MVPTVERGLLPPVFCSIEIVGDRPRIELCWIKAHAGSRWNEYADALAGTYQRER